MFKRSWNFPLLAYQFGSIQLLVLNIVFHFLNVSEPSLVYIDFLCLPTPKRFFEKNRTVCNGLKSLFLTASYFYVPGWQKREAALNISGHPLLSGLLVLVCRCHLPTSVLWPKHNSDPTCHCPAMNPDAFFFLHLGNAISFFDLLATNENISPFSLPHHDLSF